MKILCYTVSHQEVKWKSWHVYTPKSQVTGSEFKKLPICVTRNTLIPKDQTLSIWVVNLDQLPVTLHKITKIASAELIREEAICSVYEKELPQNTALTNGELVIILQSPLPSEITDVQKEQFSPIIYVPILTCYYARSK